MKADKITLPLPTYLSEGFMAFKKDGFLEVGHLFGEGAACSKIVILNGKKTKMKTAIHFLLTLYFHYFIFQKTNIL